MNAPTGLGRVEAAADLESGLSVARTPDSTSRVDVRQRRGLLTVIGAFVLCPCHLPLTLGLLLAALGGTGAGVFLHHHVVLAGTVVTLSWGVLTWRGLWLMRKGTSCPLPANQPR